MKKALNAISLITKGYRRLSVISINLCISMLVSLNDLEINDSSKEMHFFFLISSFQREEMLDFVHDFKNCSKEIFLKT